MKTPSASSGGARAKRPPVPGDPFITLEDMTVRVRDRFILPGTSWEIRAGESWAILGPNGAGKSSLARVLMDDVPTSKGTVMRHHPDAARDRIGWVSPELQEWLLGAEENRVENGGCAGRDGDARNGPRDDPLGQPSGHRQRSRVSQDRETARDRLSARQADAPPLDGRDAQGTHRPGPDEVPAAVVLDEPFGGIDAASRE